MKQIVVYSRVSTENQKEYGVSLDAQVERCKHFALLNNQIVTDVIKEAGSAYNSVPPKCNNLTNLRNSFILVYNVDRFSRNVKKGEQLALRILDNGNTLIFVNDKLMLTPPPHDKQSVTKFKMLLTAAEQESQRIATRVKASLKKKRMMGYFTGGIPKYGYTKRVVDGGSVLVPDPYEISVIKFIKLCRTCGSTANEINATLKEIREYEGDWVPLELFCGKTLTTEIKKPMYYKEIASILNDYGVRKRGRLWKSSTASSVAKNKLDKEVANFEININ